MDIIRQEQRKVRTVCVQFEPERAIGDATNIRQAFRAALPDAEIAADKEAGAYKNIMFEVKSPGIALSRIHPVLNSPSVGSAARASCIVVCQGEHGWDDYLLLHHYDPRESVVISVAQLGQ